jgi:geranylgeranyl diphosphate synthase type I
MDILALTEIIDLTQIQKAVEEELRQCILYSGDPVYQQYEEMFTYQMDWENNSPAARGKRVRPLLLLLSTFAASGDWHRALPAAASLELMHNFSLIHDDIQDQSLLRRGKDTVWVKWGEALAINAGDAMLTLSTLAVQRLQKDHSAQVVLQTANLVHTACLNLTRGQFLDISFESRGVVTIDEYTQMINGKTCALLSAALEIGGLLANTSPDNQALLRQCGFLLGQAYQIQDDWLGIWGDNALTGKSNQSDLLARKKSYPILSGLAKKGAFSALWAKTPAIASDQIPAFVNALENDGIKLETETRMESLYQQTQSTLRSLGFPQERLIPLQNLIDKLVNRAQ